MRSADPGPVPDSTAIRRALARARDGKTLDQAEAVTLLHARGVQLTELLSYAARTRDAGLAAAGRARVITYSRKVFIPLTRLCRDRCGYCTFVTVPGRLDSPFLSPDEVLDIARRGAALGCKEALFTLGDRPEARWRQAREWLDAHGYDDTLSYVRAMAIGVLEQTGLLPHLNPGVLSWQDFQRLKPVAPSMGMMLETTAERLYAEPGGPHFGSPDKDPKVRLRVLEDAGRSAVPFTTGILIGIGETLAERADSIFAIRAVAREYGGVQEVIVQNFRAKPDTKMRGVPDAELDDLAATIAVARLVLGPWMRIQAPPNLIGEQYQLILEAGIDDWGGVSPLTPDHVNPERPWPQIDDLAERTAAAGFTLRERLTIYPGYIREPWLDPRLQAHVAALADPRTGLAADGAMPAGLPWQEPDGGWGEAAGRTDLHVTIDSVGRTADRRADFAEVYGDWAQVAERIEPAARPGTAASQAEPARLRPEVLAALRSAERDPAGLTDAQALALLDADGPELDALAALADAIRRDVVGDDITYVVNRNINFTNVCYTGCRFCAFAQRRTDADAYTLSLEQIGDRAAEAWEAGATEVCMQGGIHPDLPGTAYFDIAAEVKRRCPDMHVHAFSPMEVMNGSARTGLPVRDWLQQATEAGVSSLPGTAAEILDDDVRWVLTRGKLPTSAWIEVMTTAHDLGIPTTATMMYGHVDTPAHWVGHLRVIRSIAERTGGFTEFVLLPFVHASSPIYLAGLARPGPTRRENRAVHAVSRLLLHGAIDSIQCSWVKLGDDLCRDVLNGGVNDLGGTLMEETISRMAGSQNGSFKTISQLADMVAPTGRELRQRTTLYEDPSAERLASARASDGVCASVRRGSQRSLPFLPPLTSRKGVSEMSGGLVAHQVRLTGWGMTEPSVAGVVAPEAADEVAELVKGAGERGVIARGLGRSYNNAAQNDGGLVISTTAMRKVLSFDPETGLVSCEAGVSLEQLMTGFLPSGWFVPVSPGTRQVTVGGAIAADVHGKNHHSAGSFARHVTSFDLLLANGMVQTVTPEANPELFWGTAGGMGLTGIVLRATVRLKKVETSRLIVDTVRTADIDETMAYLSATDQDYDYTVAWTDCLASGGRLGRSVITSGDFATIGEVRYRDRGEPLAFSPRSLIGAPPVFPSGLINRHTVALLNEAWFRKAPRRRTGEIQTIGTFFHPLDGIRNWNRVYGPAGFRQYQFVVPFGAEDVVRRALERISALRAPSFVTVLKRFGEGDPGLLSFPMPGWTMALDFPAKTPWLDRLLSELDEMVLQAGGRLYLAKDSRIPAGLMGQMYPRLAEFRKLREEVDPMGVLHSDLSRRLGL